MFNGNRNKYFLNFQAIDEVKVLVSKLKYQKKSDNIQYTIFKVTEDDIIIFVYPNGEKKPRLAEFENFNSFKEYRISTNLDDVIKFNDMKKSANKKANIKNAKIEGSKKVYWIKYT